MQVWIYGPFLKTATEGCWWGQLYLHNGFSETYMTKWGMNRVFPQEVLLVCRGAHIASCVICGQHCFHWDCKDYDFIFTIYQVFQESPPLIINNRFFFSGKDLLRTCRSLILNVEGYTAQPRSRGPTPGSDKSHGSCRAPRAQWASRPPDEVGSTTQVKPSLFGQPNKSFSSSCLGKEKLSAAYQYQCCQDMVVIQLLQLSYSNLITFPSNL